MTVQEKLLAIESAGWPIAFDGCHKLYFLEDKAREENAIASGYEIFPASELTQLYEGSCGLRFVSRWGYDNDDFKHPWNIGQFEEEDSEC